MKKLVGLVALAVAGTYSAFAASWHGNAGGVFDSTTGWENGAQPSEGDPLVFYYTQSAPITFGSITSFTSANMTFGATGLFVFKGTFDLGAGHSLLAGGDLNIKNGQNITIASGTFGSNGGGGHYWGWQGAGGSTLTVSGADAVYQASDDAGKQPLQLSMGFANSVDNSGNTIVVKDGGLLRGRVMIGMGASGSNNVIRVTGEGSRFVVPATVSNGSPLTIGKSAGHNNVTIADGASFAVESTSDYVYVGMPSSANSADGNSLVLTNQATGAIAGTLAVGCNSGNNAFAVKGNRVAVQDGASLAVAGTLRLGGNTGASNVVEVTDGGRLAVEGEVLFGNSANSGNELRVLSGGTFDGSGAAFNLRGVESRVTAENATICATNADAGAVWMIGGYPGTTAHKAQRNVFEVTGTGARLALSNVVPIIGYNNAARDNVLRIADGAVATISATLFAKDRNNTDIAELRVGSFGGAGGRLEIDGGMLDMGGLGIDCGRNTGWYSTNNVVSVTGGGVIRNAGTIDIGKTQPGNALVLSNGTIQATSLAFANNANYSTAASCRVAGASSQVEVSSLYLCNALAMTFELPPEGYEKTVFKAKSVALGEGKGGERPSVSVVVDPKCFKTAKEYVLFESESDLPSDFATAMTWTVTDGCRLKFGAKTVSVCMPRGMILIVR